MLQEAPYQWLHELLECFNAGEVHTFSLKPALGWHLFISLHDCQHRASSFSTPSSCPQSSTPYNYHQQTSKKRLPLSPSCLSPPLGPLPSGDIHLYDSLCARHGAVLNQQPALVAHERRLREKITIACLLDLVSR